MIITDVESLRVKCHPVLPDEVDSLRLKLEEALEWSSKQGKPGVGLACPQIGIAKTMATVRIDQKHKVDLVNANIVKTYDLVEFKGEGCLSFPDMFETTMRYKEIVVKNDIWPNRFIATDFMAVVIQHELQHLDGILLPDVAISKNNT